jgi:hypothetical protein
MSATWVLSAAFFAMVAAALLRYAADSRDSQDWHSHPGGYTPDQGYRREHTPAQDVAIAGQALRSAGHRVSAWRHRFDQRHRPGMTHR